MQPSSHFLKNNVEMIEAARHCINQRQHLPALVLMYTHIDTLAWAGSTKQRQSTRRNFEAWVSRWLIPEIAQHAPSLTSTDLYAARCSVLHSLTSKSDLTVQGKAKEIAYAWGNADAALMNATLASTSVAAKLVTLHYEILFKGICQAVANFMEAAELDASLKAQLEQAASIMFYNTP